MQRGQQGAGLFQQAEAGLFERRRAVVEGQPFVGFCGTGLFELAQAGAALFGLGQQDGNLLAGDFEVQAGQVPGRFGLLDFLIPARGFGGNAASASACATAASTLGPVHSGI